MQNKKPTIDKEVLVDARPDLSVFIAGYPLPKSTAEMLRTILIYIEDISLEQFNEVLLPFYQDAINNGRLKKAEQGELNISATIDEIKADMTYTVSKISNNLPTIKEILTKQQLRSNFE